jgi:DNA (cytosine-5)-methyltransferase 1
MKIGTDFSGIGSPEMALKLLNIEHEQVFACDIDKYARKSYEAIHGTPQTFYDDITKRDHSDIPQLDLYVAGFPCQSFSMAGKRKGFDDVRGTLFFNVAEFIKTNQPKCFILENVKGLLSHDGGKTFQTIISLLTDNGGTANGQIFIPYFEDGLGYHIYYKVLNTKDYGIPQNRERIFIVGFKEFREFNFPKPFPLELRLKDMLQDNPDYKYWIKDINTNDRLKKTLDKHKNISGIKVIDSYNQSIHEIMPTMSTRVNASNCTHLHIDDKYFLSDKMLEYFKVHNDRHEKKGTGFTWQPKEGDDIANALRANAALCATDNTIKVIKKSIKQDVSTCIDASYYKGFGIRNGVCRQVVQTNWKQLTEQRTEEAKRIRSENMKKGKDYSPRRGKELVERKDELANTVTSTQGKEQLLTNGYRIRRLTPLECFRLQGFPDDAFFRAEKVNSDTQLYKQAGNSITTCVMVELFKKIYNYER